MESDLEAVRDSKTGVVLFYKKRLPPFKTARHSMSAPKLKKNPADDVLSSKNVQVMSDFRKAAADAQVMLDFGDGDYGFWDNFQCLEKEFPSHSSEKLQSNFWGEVALLSGPRALIKDAQNLSRDVYNLSSEEDMLNEFKKENLI